MRAAAATGLAMVLAGCSMNLGVFSLTKESQADVTGSITKSASPLSPKLNDEDWRRAQAAMVLAVDPLGNGAPVRWDNPESGHKGQFVAAGPLYLMENRICRPFTAELNVKGEDSTVNGASCRLGPNEWVIQDLKQR